MGSHYKVLVFPPSPLTSAELTRSGAQVRVHRGWLEVLGAEWKSDAQELSKRFMTSGVWWSMQQAPIDQVWLFCFHHGLVVRELRFSAEEEGWAVNRGEGMPFEDTSALALWLRKWRGKKAPLMPKDGVRLLNAFIGGGGKKVTAKKATGKKATGKKVTRKEKPTAQKRPVKKRPVRKVAVKKRSVKKRL